MRHTIKFILPIALIGVAAAVFQLLTLDPALPAREAPEIPALLIEVDTARAQPVTWHVESQGTVSAAIRSDLVSQVGGQVVDVAPNFVSGGFFERDSMLVQLDTSDYEIALRRAESNLVQFSTEVDNQKILAEVNQRYRDDVLGIGANGGAGGADSPVLADLRRALAGLEKAQADLDQAELNLARSTIRAPYDGLIVEKTADLGQVVGPQSLLAKMVSVDYAEVRLPVSLREMRFLDESLDVEEIALPVELKANLGNGTIGEWQAVIVRSEGIVDPTSRVVYLVARVDDPYDRMDTGKIPLRIGTFVTARIRGLEAGNLFSIPRHVVGQDGVVWVLNEDDEIWPRQVTVEHRDERFAYVSAGLRDGEQYCITPLDQPVPGTRVRFDE